LTEGDDRAAYLLDAILREFDQAPLQKGQSVERRIAAARNRLKATEVDTESRRTYEALDRALTRLATEHERLGRVVELRWFGGLSNAEIATMLDMSERTVQRCWFRGRAWVREELKQDR
jgi:RNA polymerase sigma factor (sigma-70 family)